MFEAFFFVSQLNFPFISSCGFAMRPSWRVWYDYELYAMFVATFFWAALWWDYFSDFGIFMEIESSAQIQLFLMLIVNKLIKGNGKDKLVVLFFHRIIYFYLFFSNSILSIGNNNSNKYHLSFMLSFIGSIKLCNCSLRCTCDSLRIVRT